MVRYLFQGDPQAGDERFGKGSQNRWVSQPFVPLSRNAWTRYWQCAASSGSLLSGPGGEATRVLTLATCP